MPLRLLSFPPNLSAFGLLTFVIPHITIHIA